MVRELMAALTADVLKKLDALRRSGAVPDGFEENERASLPKIAAILAAEDIALSDWARREIKNMRRMV